MSATADSFKFRWLELMNQADLTHTQRRVAIYCFSRSNPDGSNVRPAQQTVATDLGMHVNSVANAMKKLSSQGWLVLTQKGMAGNGFNRTNVYQLRLPDEIALPTSQSVGNQEGIDTSQSVGNPPPIPTSQSVGIDGSWDVIEEPNTHNFDSNTHNFEPNTHTPGVWPNNPLHQPFSSRSQNMGVVAKADATPANAGSWFDDLPEDEAKAKPQQPKQYRDRPLMSPVPDRSKALQRIEAGVPNLTSEEIAEVEYWLSNGDSEVTIMKQLRDDRRALDFSRPEKLLTKGAS